MTAVGSDPVLTTGTRAAAFTDAALIGKTAPVTRRSL